MGSVSRLRPVHFVLLAAPLLWIVIAFVHPDGESQLSEAIADQADRWIFVHAAQLVLTPFLAAGVWMLLLDIESVAARIARIALAFGWCSSAPSTRSPASPAACWSVTRPASPERNGSM